MLPRVRQHWGATTSMTSMGLAMGAEGAGSGASARSDLLLFHGAKFPAPSSAYLVVALVEQLSVCSAGCEMFALQMPRCPELREPLRVICHAAPCPVTPRC